MRIRLAAAALAAALILTATVPVADSAIAATAWDDGRWRDERGNVWLGDRQVWWHPDRGLYYVDEQWRTGAGRYYDSASGQWRWPFAAAESAGPAAGEAAGAARPQPTPARPGPVHPGGAGVDRWRPLVVEIFGPANADTVLRIMACESGGDPNATSPAGDRGLMQIAAIHYDSTHDPRGNLLAAHRISNGGADWSAWGCR